MFNRSREESRSAESDFLCTVFEELRALSDVAPASGFYERVCSRIQEINRQSIWAPLIYSRFRWRFVTACLTLTLGTLSYLLAADWSLTAATFSSANAKQRRDAVLTEIVTYRKRN